MDPLNLNNNVYTNETLLPDNFGPHFLNLEYFFNKIYLYFHKMFGLGPDGPSFLRGGSTEGVMDAGSVGGANTSANYFHLFSSFLTDFLYLLIIIFMTVIAYIIVRMLEIRKKEHEHIHHESHEYVHKHGVWGHTEDHSDSHAEAHHPPAKPKNDRWEAILKHVYSENQADWKLAIIDADEMLLSLMTDLDFKGDGLGEKLKNADREEFKNLSKAWEVHTIRNRIAHEGLSYQISQREAKRVIALYEDIFYEFGYI